MTQPVYVVTTNDEADNHTSTAGAFTDLAAARATTEVVTAELNEQHPPAHPTRGPRFKGFVEEWEGGTFTAHHELRGTEWWVAREPSWAPTRDTTTAN